MREHKRTATWFLACCAIIATAGWLRAQTGERFTVIVLPDTQNYYEDSPGEVFKTQTRWIVTNRQALNIRFVTHEGDIVDQSSNATQWGHAREAMNILDTGSVPYSVLPGNHDMGSGSLYEQYFGADSGRNFGVTSFKDYPWWGGTGPSGNTMNYQLFSGGGRDYVIIHIEYMHWLKGMGAALQNETTLANQGDDDDGVRDVKAKLRWVDGVLKAHPNRKAIITTHSFLTLIDGQPVRHVDTDPESGTDFFWRMVVVPNANVFLILNGHDRGNQAEVQRSDFVNGRLVHQLLANYQSRSGGQGWLRILEFVPTEQRIYVKTYSPHLGTYETDANSQFVLAMDGTSPPPGPAAPTNIRVIR